MTCRNCPPYKLCKVNTFSNRDSRWHSHLMMKEDTILSVSLDSRTVTTRKRCGHCGKEFSESKVLNRSFANNTRGKNIMHDWKYRFDVNRYVAAGDPNNAKATVKQIVEALRDKAPFDQSEGKRLLGDLEEAEDAQEFNDAWHAIYDFSDDHDVWLGVPA